VSYAVKGLLARKRQVAIVRDATETLASEAGDKTLAELQQLGARLVTTEEALAGLGSTKSVQQNPPSRGI
jgi:hypothetical protein